LRAVRAESLRQANDIQQLRDKQAEAQRKASLAEAAETSMRAQLKAAENTIYKLKEEAARMKTLVAQTRAACANEVRKRDRQIDGLKKAVTDTGRTRGATKNAGITTITVTGEIGGETNDKVTPAAVTQSDAYDLRMETNSFLAELAKGLSAENETLLDLVRQITQSLREMSGWDKEASAQAPSTDGHALTLPVNPDEMAHDIHAILEHLRTILTNPSFVPIEEVVMREEEINRLREGWERMETRWAEAVHLMDGWRKRMQADGRPVNVEELKMGLRLSPVRIRDVAETANSLGLRLAAVREETEEPSMLQSPSPADSLHLIPAPDYEEELEDSDAESSIFEDDVDVNDLDVEEPNVEVLQQSVMFSSPPLPPPPQLSPLKDSYSAGNRGQTDSIPFKPIRGLGEFTTIVEENTCDLAHESQAPVPPPHFSKPASPKRLAQRSRPSSRAETPPTSADISDARSTPDSEIFPKPSGEETSGKKPEPAPARTRRQGTTVVGRPPRHQPAAPPSSARTATRPASTRPGSSRTTQTRPQAQPQPHPQNTQPPCQPTETSPTQAPPPPPPPSHRPAQRTTSTTSTASTASAQSTTSLSRSPTKSGGSRLPLPRTTNVLPAPQQSPLSTATIAAKLAASEREADAARVRAKLKAARLARMGRDHPVLQPQPPASSSGNADSAGGNESSGEPIKRDRERRREREREEVVSLSRGGGADSESRAEGTTDGGETRRGGEDVDAVDFVAVEKPRKRERRTSKAASRRRSTLNPWELQSLIQGDVAAVAAAEGA
jgi:hypothetical protein